VADGSEWVPGDMDHFTEVCGKDGWELVAVVPSVAGYTGPGGIIQTHVHWLYFKKPLEDEVGSS
jgi:hypothetical protein